MCGIAGVVARGGDARPFISHLRTACERLVPRGPDHGDVFVDGRVALGHRRLAIIDTSPAGNQPMTDETGRYTIVYNGEVYNFRELRRSMVDEGIRFSSHSDSEVMLKLYITRGASALDDVNGFFAFAIWDREEDSVFVARDRIGIKPLYYHEGEDVFLFASELKAILAFPVEKQIDDVSLFQYLQLSYIPAPNTILSGVKKLEPGCCISVVGGRAAAVVRRYYEVPYGGGAVGTTAPSYDEARGRIVALLEDAVRERLVSDVPLGAFLSGGIDSTIVAALASRHVDDLKTYSIGFEDDAFYDETPDAVAAAKAFGTDHTVFRLTTGDLYDHLFDALDYIDEPFADSSALAVYVLSRRTREHVKVALSGDGADELFGGYNKHYAEYKARRGGALVGMVKALGPVWRALPKSRDSASANKVRQLARFARAAGLGAAQRYWEWCQFTPEADAVAILGRRETPEEHHRRVADATGRIIDDGDINDVFYADLQLVLQNDMLRKVDSMSMANSLEVRVPFLDHKFVEYCFTLPGDYKIHNGVRKRILRDAFSSIVPEHVLAKPKHGFEVPLMRWFRGDLRGLIEDDLLSDSFVGGQGVFDPGAVRNLRGRLFSSRPGDIAPLVWALVVFQHWWRKYM
jgi:asparagine synthase (glutamine-hydrolysing)